MSNNVASTVAQIVFNEDHAPRFAHLVADLTAHLNRLPATLRQVEWQSDDIALFDVAETRIGLCLDGHDAKDLYVSVGAAPGVTELAPAEAYRAIAERIVKRFGALHSPQEVIWHQHDSLPQKPFVARSDDTFPAPRFAPPRNIAPHRAAVVRRLSAPQEGSAPVAIVRNAELFRLRKALYDGQEPVEVPGLMTRVTNQAMQASVHMALLPVATMVLIYGFLRGQGLVL